MSIFSLLGAQRITENMIPICTFSTKKHIENYGNCSLAWPKQFWQKDLMSLNIYLIQVKTNGTVQKRINQHHQETHQKIHSRWCLNRSLFFFISAWNVKTKIHPKKKKRERESSANPDTQNIPAICCSTEVQHGRAHSQRS